jgi:acetylglutamate kinase
LTPRFADGLRVTDESTLDSVVSVLAGQANTALVAAIGAAGGRAVGLTGADAQIGLAVKTGPLATINGERVDLGLVGEPAGGDVALVRDLLRSSYIPVVASIGVTSDGTLLNINADTFAAHLAASLHARRLIVAGTTPGVLDNGGDTIPELSQTDVEQLTASGTAHSGMVAKLTACRQALARGVTEVLIVAGRGVEDFDMAAGTKVC